MSCIFHTYISIICKCLSTRSEVGPLSSFCIHCLTLISCLQNMQNTFNKANLKNNFVSPYPTLFTGMGWSFKQLFFFTSQIRYPFFLIVYSKTCLKRPLSKRQKNCLFYLQNYQDRLSHNAGQKYCRMLPGSILQYFRPAFSAHLLCISLSGRFRQVLLHSPTIGNKIKYTNNLLR